MIISLIKSINCKLLAKKIKFLFNFIIIFKNKNTVQNGLLNKLKGIYWKHDFDEMTIEFKHEDQLNGQITLNQISFAFYSLICC